MRKVSNAALRFVRPRYTRHAPHLRARYSETDLMSIEEQSKAFVKSCVDAFNLTAFGRRTLRNNTAHRRLPLRWAAFEPSNG